MFAINIIGKDSPYYQANGIYFQSDKIWLNFSIEINILLHISMAIISLLNFNFNKDTSGS